MNFLVRPLLNTNTIIGFTIIKSLTKETTKFIMRLSPVLHLIENLIYNVP